MYVWLYVRMVIYNTYIDPSTVGSKDQTRVVVPAWQVSFLTEPSLQPVLLSSGAKQLVSLSFHL